MKVNCQGVFPAISTQFNDDDSINDESNARMSEDLIKNGIDGIIALVTMGENPSLSPQENRKFIKHTVETVNGRILVLSGFTENTAEFESQYAKDIEQLGVDGLMRLPAMVYRSTDQEGGAHHQTVAQSIKMPIMIYNTPVSFGINLEMTAILSKEDNIVAIKESTTDTHRLTELQSQFNDRFNILCAVDDSALEGLLLNTTGWISGRENVFPRESMTLLKLARASRIEQARKIYHWFMPLLLLDTTPTLVQCIKCAEQLFGRGCKNVRMPRMTLTGNERAYV